LVDRYDGNCLVNTDCRNIPINNVLKIRKYRRRVSKSDFSKELKLPPCHKVLEAKVLVKDDRKVIENCYYGWGQGNYKKKRKEGKDKSFVFNRVI